MLRTNAKVIVRITSLIITKLSSVILSSVYLEDSLSSTLVDQVSIGQTPNPCFRHSARRLRTYLSTARKGIN